MMYLFFWTLQYSGIFFLIKHVNYFLKVVLLIHDYSYLFHKIPWPVLATDNSFWRPVSWDLVRASFHSTGRRIPWGNLQGLLGAQQARRGSWAVTYRSRQLKQQGKNERVKPSVTYCDGVALKPEKTQTTLVHFALWNSALVEDRGTRAHVGVISLLRKPWTKSSSSFMVPGVSGGRGDG